VSDVGSGAEPLTGPGGLGRVWAGWRLAPLEGRSVDGQPTARPLDPVVGLSLFETIEQADLPDEETYVLWRGTRVFALLNVYPYTSGHLMVLPRRAVPSLEDLEPDEHAELWEVVRDAVVAAKAAFRPDGMNVGINLGTAGGGSVPGHLHVHVVPRWSADTNFMTTVAEVRVLPQSLSDSWRRLRDAWPR
jgi:diadenosine tetraphosphate (Ap4A) HIT family hydrolase